MLLLTSGGAFVTIENGTVQIMRPVIVILVSG